jgi:hypothetical protein
VTLNHTLFSIWLRIAGSLGVGLIAAVFAQQPTTYGPVTALDVTGWVISAISAAGLAVSALLPAAENVATDGNS